MGRPSIPIKTRLLNRTHKNEVTGCWEWLGARNAFGHGLISRGTTGLKSTHKTAYEEFKGAVPEGLVVRHKCDNPICVNPDHLELGTPADNRRDTSLRGRNKTKLSDDQVREIRTSAETGRALATKFDVSTALISKIRNRLDRALVEDA